MAEDRRHSHLSWSSAARLRRAIVLLLLAIFAGLIVQRSVTLWWRHERVMVVSEQRAVGLAHILGEHLAQRIATVDAALTQLVLHSERVGGPKATPHLWAPVLDAAISGLKGVGSLAVLNRDGVVTHSTVKEIVGQSRAGRLLFQRLADAPLSGVVADAPYRGSVSGRLLIPIGKRLTNSQGEFVGAVVATLVPDDLRDFYRSTAFEPGTVVTVLHPDGHVLLTHDVDTNASLKLTADYTLFAPIRFDSAGGALRGPLRVEGETYVTGFRSLSSPPLSLAVSLKQQSILTDWRRELVNSVTVLVVVGALMLIAGFLVNREIRARAASDAALRENRARFHEIMYNAPVLVSVKDVDGRIIFMNKALEELLRTTQADASGKTLHQFTPSAPATLITSLDREVAATGKALQRELTYPSEDGTRTALFVKFPLFDRQGNVEAVASFSTDLTAQRRAETWFRTIVDNAPALIVVKDLQGRFIFVNRAIESIVGMKADDVLGKTGHDLFPADYADLHDQYDRDVVNGRRPIQREIIAPYPHGLRTLLFAKFPIFDAAGAVEAIGSISTDITGQKRVEAQLAHAQRMEAVGQLTGGIAHDFNNLLTVIIGNSEILMAELKGSERLQPLVQVTLDAAERSATLTQRLLAFGRRQMLEPKPTDVNVLLQDMNDLIARAAGERVRIEYAFADDLWSGVIDPVQLETAILNLVVNSRDAMPKGGRITVETANAHLDNLYVQVNPDAKQGDYVAISVSDTGTGMPPDVVARVFEPFFTTKEVGKGTGLGLPTIYGFLKQSGGHVKIYSEVDHGTVVRLYIPRAEAPTLVPDLPAGEAEQLPRGGESILLVEDDKLVRAHTEGQLLELGYRVTTAGTADEAFNIARLSGKPDLLLTDVIMPGGANGRELAARMRAVWPDLKVLCTSGYTDGALPSLSGGDEMLHFLAKPFRRQDLALKVREAIETPVPAKSKGTV